MDQYDLEQKREQQEMEKHDIKEEEIEDIDDIEDLVFETQSSQEDEDIVKLFWELKKMHPERVLDLVDSDESDHEYLIESDCD